MRKLFRRLWFKWALGRVAGCPPRLLGIDLTLARMTTEEIDQVLIVLRTNKETLHTALREAVYARDRIVQMRER